MSKALTRNEWYDLYMRHRAVYRRKKPANDFVRCFLNWCDIAYPDTPYLTQEMVSTWCTKRDTESTSSRGARVSALHVFLDFISDRDGGSFQIDYVMLDSGRREPVLFNHEELSNFFRALDEITTGDEYGHPAIRRLAKLKALQLPVFFRLLYSSGIRPPEARWIRCEDVDLDKGIIYLRRTKGYNERLVALHPSMTELLRQYDYMMDRELPGREVFFPSVYAEYHNSAWIRYNFNRYWYKYNPRPPEGEREIVAYCFRHNYAVENIMNWEQDGYNADKRVVALSKSMGHVSIQATQYYFHLTPRFADLLERTEGASLDDIIPNISEP